MIPTNKPLHKVVAIRHLQTYCFYINSAPHDSVQTMSFFPLLSGCPLGCIIGALE